MRELTLTLWALVIAMTASAQTVEDRHSLDGPDESQALAILDSYRDIAPPHLLEDSHLPIVHWHPRGRLIPNRLPGTNHLLWMKSSMLKRVNIEPPKFLDYNSVTLRFGQSGSSVTISNGSAYNYMVWPGSPAAYRDARTLSFPLPR